MNRRFFLKAVSAITAIMAARPTLAFSTDPRIIVEPGAAANPHTAMAIEWCREQIAEGILYCRNNVFDYTVKLTDPTFRILPGKKVWNWMTGYTDEDGLTISIVERDIHITNTFIATSIGYDEYWGERPPHDLKRPPDYFVRRPWLDYDTVKLIEGDLPKDHIGHDMRWLERAVAEGKKSALPA